MAALTVQAISRSGLEAAYVSAAGGGDTFANAGNVFLHAINGSGGDITITFATAATVDGLAVADREVVVTAGEERMIGPFQKDYYNNSSGNVAVTYSGVTSLTVAAISLTPVT